MKIEALYAQIRKTITDHPEIIGDGYISGIMARLAEYGVCASRKTVGTVVRSLGYDFKRLGRPHGGAKKLDSTKRCKRCRLFKPNTTEFYKNPARSKVCLLCIKLRIKQWLQDNREYALQRGREYARQRTVLKRIEAVPAGYIDNRVAAPKYGYSRTHLSKLVNSKKVKGRVILNVLYVDEESLRQYASRKTAPYICKFCGESDVKKMKNSGRGRLARICKACDKMKQIARKQRLLAIQKVG